MLKGLGSLVRSLIGLALSFGLAVGITLAIFLGYQYFTDESAWREAPRIEDGRLYLHVAHEDGRIFRRGDRFSNVTVATLERVSKRQREYVNIYSILPGDVQYLGVDGIKLDGVALPPNVLNEDDTLFACIFIEGDSVGCRDIDR